MADPPRILEEVTRNQRPENPFEVQKKNFQNSNLRLPSYLILYFFLVIGYGSTMLTILSLSKGQVFGFLINIMNNMLTIEEVRNFLEIEQEEVEKLLKDRRLRAYKIGGTYIRFRKEEVINLRNELKPKFAKEPAKTSWLNRAGEFWRFNNFYLVSIAIVAALVIYFVRT